MRSNTSLGFKCICGVFPIFYHNKTIKKWNWIQKYTATHTVYKVTLYHVPLNQNECHHSWYDLIVLDFLYSSGKTYPYFLNIYNMWYEKFIKQDSSLTEVIGANPCLQKWISNLKPRVKSMLAPATAIPVRNTRLLQGPNLRHLLELISTKPHQPFLWHHPVYNQWDVRYWSIGRHIDDWIRDKVPAWTNRTESVSSIKRDDKQ